MKWYQSAARWGLMLAVGMSGIGYLAHGLSGRVRTQNEQPINLNRHHAGDLVRVVEDVNAEFQKSWSIEQMQAAAPVDWHGTARRVSLALVGSGVSLEDLRLLESLPEPDRKATLVERLLQDRRFSDYWAERLARSYVGADQGPFIVYRRRRFVTWLSDAIYDNTAYSKIVRQLITARGIWTDNPQVNFLTVTLDGQNDGRPDPIRLAARTSRAFLGMRIDCLQCHDDFLGNVRLGTQADPAEGSQRDFHGLAAFYAGARSTIGGIRDDDRAYEYQFLYEDETEIVEPVVPFLPELIPDGNNLSKSRHRLAKWVTHPENAPAARAAVNRVWAIMFGKPLHDPVDDIPLNGPFPPGLDRLAQDFSEHHWDLRRLIRIITNLQVFQLDSRADFEVTQQNEDALAVFPLVRLRPEQVAGSIVQACRLSTIDRDSAFIFQLQAFGDINDFIRRYGDTGEDEFNQDSVTITQRLLAMNGKLMRERTQDNPIANAASQIAMFAKDDRQAIEIAYRAVLNRPCSEQEIEHWVEQARHLPERRDFVEDLYWMLLNSSEFAWNH